MTTHMNEATLCRESDCTTDEPIAIVGMGMRLPGNVNTAGEFWDMLVSGKSGHGPVPQSRYNADAFFDSSTGPMTGYFLQEDPSYFDAEAFSIPAKDARLMDPQQRLLLEVVSECLEDAGETAWRGRQIGCYVGVFGEDWLELSLKGLDPRPDRHHALTTGGFALSNRISYEFDFRGPSMTIQTGCSASLVGLHEACQGLRSGQCSAAIVAGTNLILTPTMTSVMNQIGVLSPSGKCKTFDANADGYGRGEAVNAVYVKRLSDALKDGDSVRAVIRSTAVNFDGKTAVITNPSGPAQEALIRSAYKQAQIDRISDTGFFECHGTGTSAGDSVETSVVAKIFEGHNVLVGSVKPNCGHSEGASGLTSIIKATLALEHRTVPPNINFEQPNPKVNSAVIQVPVKPTPWPEDRHERVSINSFGVGGANAHAILESASAYGVHKLSTEGSDRPRLLVVSGHNKQSLQNRVEDTVRYINSHPTSIRDLAYTLALRREHLNHRAFAVVHPDTPVDASHFQSSSKIPSPPAPTFVFTGQGAQWAGMGKRLLETEPMFYDEVKKMDEVLQRLPDPPEWSLLEELSRVGFESRVNEVELAQPLCTALQLGILHIMTHWGIQPSVVVGHSSGEIAAACASGAITVESAIVVAFYRGKLAKLQEGSGAMASVGLSPEDVLPFLIDGVVVACENSPRNVTISGPKDKLAEVINSITAALPGTFCRRLRVRVAYHSPQMETLGTQYEDAIATYLNPAAQMRPMMSTVTGDMITDPSLLATAGHIFNSGSSLDLSTIVEKGQVLGDIPRIPWTHTEIYWTEGRPSRDWRLRSLPHHELLGSIVMEATLLEPSWRNMLRLDDIPWLSDHVIHGEVVFPAAGYIAMAGEAIRQLNVLNEQQEQNSDGYSIRNIRFESPLIIASDVPVEVIFNIKPIEIADGTMSEWHAFSVSAYNGAKWTLHCKGSVRAGSDYPIAGKYKEVGALPRPVESSRWYRTAQRYGLQYGPQFQRLQDITADPVDHVAAGIVHQPPMGKTTRYSLHPAAMDQALQLIGIAASNGRLHTVAGAFIPARIENLVVGAGAPSKVTFQARTIEDREKGQQANIDGTSEGRTIFNLEGGVLAGLAGSSRKGSDEMDLISQIQWQPDIDLLPPDRLFPPRPNRAHAPDIRALGILSLIHILAIAERIEDLNAATTIPHLTKWKAWILSEAAEIRTGMHKDLPSLSRWIDEIQPEGHDALVQVVKDTLGSLSATTNGKLPTIESNIPLWVKTPPADLLQRIFNRFDNLSTNLPRSATVECMRAVYEDVDEFMSGKSSPVETLLASDRLGRFYDDSMSRETELTEPFALLGHSNPLMRVLEIGAGTGSMTQIALSSLKTETGAPLFSRYVFTDISAGFFTTAQEKFKGQGNIEYCMLDITRDPTEQGFGAHSFDLIIASNVMHATPNLCETLRNTNKLLARNGRFVLHELWSYAPVTDYIVSVLPGWWVGENDGRPDRPYVSENRWDKELRAAGFNGAEVVERDLDGGLQPLYSIISRPDHSPPPDREVTILSSTLDEAGWPGDVAACFRESGYQVYWSTLDSPPCGTRAMILLLEFDSPYFTGGEPEAFVRLQRFLMQNKGCRFLWVTQSSTLNCSDPHFSIIHGVARVLRRELSFDFSVFEMDSFETPGLKYLLDLYEKIQRGREIPDIDLEYEFLLKDGIVHTARSYRMSLSQQLTTQLPVTTPRRLGIEQVGMISTLQWEPSSLAMDLNPGEVEVDVCYAGLNFKDTLLAMGLIGTPDDMGLEATGIVRRVASDITDVTPGDRVGVLGNGLACNRTVVRREAVSILPDSLSLEDAAAMLTVYGTAIYSLMHIGNLQNGQSVLIHSAAGGVGISAINICQMLGAVIYATVGNEEKAEYLVETFNIPREHIFNSHDNSFVPDVMHATNGRGVDIVLNSLGGKLLHASWECVASFGKMIEIGRRDLLSHGMLSMSPFLEDRSFHGVYLANVSKNRPDIVAGMIRQCFDLVQKGQLRPIRPLHIFKGTQVREAFRYLQTGKHMGKVVIEMSPDPSELPCTPVKSKAYFPPDVSYLIVGGLGGIGRSVSRWLVEHGAREIVYLSRSAGSDEHRGFRRELEVQGCQVTCVTGNVTDPDDVKRAIGTCENRLAGVIQMALYLQDRTFEHMTPEEWDTGLAPKVTGTWNLHSATQDMDLSFFVMFGSISGSAGSLGQANYAASNTFLTGLATYRRQRGLAASVLNLGPVEDVGIVSQRSDLAQTTSVVSAQPIPESVMLDTVYLSIKDSRPDPSSTGVWDVGINDNSGKNESTSLMRIWGRDARYAMHTNLGQSSSEEGTNGPEHRFRDFVNNVHQDPSLLNNVEAIATFKRDMAQIIAGTIANGRKLSDEEASGFAIDSLVAIEMRSWVRRAIHLDVSLSEITKAGNLGSLADHIVKLLRVQYKLGNVGE
ncbi:type I Iterative Polyketide synthase (PKS) [Aspergillus tubingensis]|nr:type I Iterative Polyketide synthase (PKS) [Aspergillus tubingensis]